MASGSLIFAKKRIGETLFYLTLFGGASKLGRAFVVCEAAFCLGLTPPGRLQTCV